MIPQNHFKPFGKMCISLNPVLNPWLRMKNHILPSVDITIYPSEISQAITLQINTKSLHKNIYGLGQQYFTQITHKERSSKFFYTTQIIYEGAICRIPKLQTILEGMKHASAVVSALKRAPFPSLLLSFSFHILIT